MWANINDHRQLADSATPPERPANTFNPTTEMLERFWRSIGWRTVVASDPVPDGYRAAAWTVVDNNDGTTCHLEPVLISLADEAAAAEAAAAAALLPVDVTLGHATVRTYNDRQVEFFGGPIVPGTESGAFELWVDSETGMVLTCLDHASPRKSKAEKDADKAAKKAKLAAIKAEPTVNKKIEGLLELLGLK